MAREDDQVDELRRRLPAFVGGMYCCSAQLVELLDRPGMTVEQLRSSAAARMIRGHVKDFDRWIHQASIVQPAAVVTREEENALNGNAAAGNAS